MDAALAGLSVGDAFGDQFFLAANRGLSPDDEPPGPWEWSDDTELACSVADVLAAQAEVTHANIEGIAGAVAVAVAASTPQTGRALFDAVLDLTPGTYVPKACAGRGR